MYAAIASQTLLGKLGSAFWDAFSGGAGPSSVGAGASKQWDADKVRKVLEGKAVVKVVDVESPAPSPRVSPKLSPALSPKVQVEKKQEDRCVASCTVMADILEESMRSLTLGKK